MIALLLGCTGPPPASEVEPHIAVAVTDFAVGGIAFASDELEVGDPVFATTGDPLVRAFDGVVYVVERGSADVVSALDPLDPGAPLWQTALPQGANVHDLVALDGLLWAPAFDQPVLFALDPADGRIVHTLDLSEFADADGLPELDHAVVIGDRLYVAAQLLDRSAGFVSTEGRILEIDPAGPTVVADYVVGPNPRIVGQDGTLLVATGLYATPSTLERVTDGALHRFDPVRGTLELLLTEQEREADIWQVHPVGAGWVMLEILADGRSRIVCFDGDQLLPGPEDAAWFVTGAVLPSGELAIGARTGLRGEVPSQRGLLLLDPAGCEFVSGFLPTPLDPYDLAAL